MGADAIAMRPRARCAHATCGKPMVRRSPLNDPAYCCYECAAKGQPDRVGTTMRNLGDGNDPAS